MGYLGTLGFSQKLSTEKDAGAKSRRTGIGLDLRETDVFTAVHLATNVFFHARSLSPPDWGHQKWNSEGEGLLHGRASKESRIKAGRQLRLASLLLGVHEEGLQPYQGAIPVLGFSREESGSPECKYGLCS